MKSTNTKQGVRVRGAVSRSLLLAAAVICLGAAGAIQAANPGVLPPHSSPYGKSYAEWSADWWQWLLEQPVVGGPTDPNFDVRAGQTGNVWFLASALQQPAAEIPSGTALFIPLMNVECSSLEPPESGFHGDTEAEQTECAKYWADHITNLVLIVDGKAMEITDDYRAVSPQFAFDAPTPWVFGDTGGAGTAVGDGYYVMLAPLSVGGHTITIRATLHFAAGELGPDPVDLLQTDLTWHITVVPAGRYADLE